MYVNYYEAVVVDAKLGRSEQIYVLAPSPKDGRIGLGEKLVIPESLSDPFLDKGTLK